MAIICFSDQGMATVLEPMFYQIFNERRKVMKTSFWPWKNKIFVITNGTVATGERFGAYVGQMITNILFCYLSSKEWRSFIHVLISSKVFFAEWNGQMKLVDDIVC